MLKIRTAGSSLVTCLDGPLELMSLRIVCRPAIVMRREMIGKTFRILISAALASLVLIAVGLLVSYLFAESQNSLGLIFFVIGAIPLVIFLPGLFGGGKSGAIHTPKVFYRLVNTLSPDHKSYQDGDESRANFNASLTWVLAGAIVWVVSYFI